MEWLVEDDDIVFDAAAAAAAAAYRNIPCTMLILLYMFCYIKKWLYHMSSAKI